jgi:hypothetical protein
MKSLLKTALILLFAIFCFTACEGPQGPPGVPGHPGQNGQDGLDGWGAYFDVQYYDIRQWTLAANGRYFYAEVSAPAITTDVFYNGAIVGYIVYNYNTSREVHIPLPYDIYYNEPGLQWTETVSFDLVPGKITFYYEPDDFYTGDIPPACMFKVVAMW